MEEEEVDAGVAATRYGLLYKNVLQTTSSIVAGVFIFPPSAMICRIVLALTQPSCVTFCLGHRLWCDLNASATCCAIICMRGFSLAFALEEMSGGLVRDDGNGGRRGVLCGFQGGMFSDNQRCILVSSVMGLVMNVVLEVE